MLLCPSSFAHLLGPQEDLMEVLQSDMQPYQSNPVMMLDQVPHLDKYQMQMVEDRIRHRTKQNNGGIKLKTSKK